MNTHRTRWAFVLCLAVQGMPAHAQEIPSAYQVAARAFGVPSAVLFAVALQESGTTLRGRRIPWPWTLNIAGAPYRYRNRLETCIALRHALQWAPSTRIDVGLGQINVGYHADRFDQPCDLLDPYRNLAISAAILRAHCQPGDDWLLAIGRYHRPAGGAPAARYRRSVSEHLTRVMGEDAAPLILASRP